MESLDQVTAQLKAIGKNLNQLTILCNMGKITCPELAEIKKGFGSAFDYLYDLMDKGVYAVAIVTAIKEKTQSRTAMKKVMDYVAQDYKTNFENANGEICKLVSGQNCCGDTAFQEFMTTKKLYRKESKVFFYQYVQSFKPDCGATPQDIHQMGRELAQRFEGYEVLIATHIDRDHWHNHLVVNSVSCDTGLKLQFNEKDLEQLRTLSDKICEAHGLEVLKSYQKPDMKPMGAGEYRAAVRGNSYNFQLMNAIDKG